jgi:hypothetical protein
MRDPTRFRRSPAARVASVLLLLAPAAGLGLLAARAESSALAGGAVAALIAAAALARHPAAWKPPASGSAVLVHLAALGWAWIYTKGSDDPLTQVVRGGMLILPVFLFAAHDLHRTGAEPRRRANRLCRALQSRTRWPAEAAAIRGLAEVRALREAAADEAGPVFKMLNDPRPEVRAAGFAALEGRRTWRPRECVALLTAAQRTYEPPVRAIAVAALGSVTDAHTLGALAGFLRDPAREVRQAAAAACVDASGRKWVFVRDSVRAYLSDPKLAADGGLPGAAGYLSAVAVCDLAAWAGEGEPLGGRAVHTLVEHYAHVLQTTPDYDLVIDLSRQVTDPSTPPGLRVELAGLLRGLGLLTPELLDRMTNADQPGPVRLLAAEALLAADPADADGLDVLRGLGRQSNREMALAIARILQTYLRLDLGLPPDGLEVKTKQAAEVARRVLHWAVGKPIGPDGNPTTPTPGGLAGLPPPVAQAAAPQAPAPGPGPNPKKIW